MVSGTATYKRPAFTKTENSEVTYLGKDPNGVLFVANNKGQAFAYTGQIKPDKIGYTFRTDGKNLKAAPDIHVIQGFENKDGKGKPIVLYDQRGGKDIQYRQQGNSDVLAKVETKNPKSFYPAKKAA